MTSYKSLLNLGHCTIRKATAMISRIIWRVFSLLYGALVLTLFTAFAVLDGSIFRRPTEEEKKELAIGKLNTHPHQIQAEKSSEVEGDAKNKKKKTKESSKEQEDREFLMRYACSFSSHAGIELPFKLHTQPWLDRQI